MFHFPKPSTLARILRDADANQDTATWRAKVRAMPKLDHAPMRQAQITAIEGVERSLAEQRFDRSLVQMATGAGKTFTAVTEAYRLLKHGGFNRVLFLVDRNNLADQTLAEFQNYRTPDDGRRFTEICNVDFDLYRIKTQISDQGSSIEAGTIVPTIDRRTRVQRFETLDETLEYTDKDLDRAVTAKAQIRLVLETFRDRLPTEIFPGRTTVPKTLIFCKDDAHAEEVVTTIREVFGKGNDFAAKITYTARDPKGHLQAFRTSASLRVAVTVDMIATGTDVKPLECVFFMRDVRSA